MTRIACRHLRWLKARNSLVNKAIDIYSQVENSEQNSHDTIHMKEPQKMEEEPEKMMEGPEKIEEKPETIEVPKHKIGTFAEKAFLALIESRKNREKEKQIMKEMKAEEERNQRKRAELENLSIKIADQVTSKIMGRLNSVESTLSHRLGKIESELLHFDEAIL